MAALPTSRDGERAKSRTYCVIAATRSSEQAMTAPVVMVSFLHYRWVAMATARYLAARA